MLCYLYLLVLIRSLGYVQFVFLFVLLLLCLTSCCVLLWLTRWLNWCIWWLPDMVVCFSCLCLTYVSCFWLYLYCFRFVGMFIMIAWWLYFGCCCCVFVWLVLCFSYFDACCFKVFYGLMFVVAVLRVVVALHVVWLWLLSCLLVSLLLVLVV